MSPLFRAAAREWRVFSRWLIGSRRTARTKPTIQAATTPIPTANRISMLSSNDTTLVLRDRWFELGPSQRVESRQRNSSIMDGVPPIKWKVPRVVMLQHDEQCLASTRKRHKDTGQARTGLAPTDRSVVPGAEQQRPEASALV